MARTRRKLDARNENGPLQRRLKREPAGWRRERLLAVRLGLEGELTLEQIAAQLGRARSCIQRWLDRFRQGGLEALLSRGQGKGPPSQLSPELATALREKLAAGAFRRAVDAQRWLTETGGRPVGLAAVYKYLKKAGARLKVPRPCHQKKDAWASRAFREVLAVHLDALELPPGRPVRVWVADEMRYGLQPVTRRVWSLRGTRPVCPVQPRYQWGYVYGAAEVDGQAQAEFLYDPTVSLEGSHRFLRQIAARDPEALHVVLWDSSRLSSPRRSGGAVRKPSAAGPARLQPRTEPDREALGPAQRPPLQSRLRQPYGPGKRHDRFLASFLARARAHSGLDWSGLAAGSSKHFFRQHST